jgi:hypothetical protein
MYLANVGGPTHNVSGWQMVADGGGADGWSTICDVRPAGVSAQVDTATNKRIDIRKTGVYDVEASVGWTSVTSGTLIAVSPGVNGVTAPYMAIVAASSSEHTIQWRGMLSLTSGDYLKLIAYLADATARTYITAAAQNIRLTCRYIGPAS